VHIDAYKKAKDVELVAVADTNGAAAEQAAKTAGIPKSFSDPAELLRQADVEAVSVCVPNAFHAGITIDALRAGKHVLCEKPPAMNAKEAEAMAEAAKKARKVLMYAFVNRFQAESQGLKKFIEAGDLGEIYHCAAQATRRRGIPGLGGWFTTKKMSGGGPLIDIGVHILDLSLWLMGFPKPVSVSAACYMKFGHKKDYVYVSMWGTKVPGGTFDVEDYASALVRFDGGATLSLECSWAANIQSGAFSTQLLGDKGGALLEVGGGLKLFGEHRGNLVDMAPQFAKADRFLEEVNNFLAAARGDGQPLCTPEQGIIVQKIIDAIYKSSDAGKEVRL
jgi:predicted dehydrogenase